MKKFDVFRVFNGEVMQTRTALSAKTGKEAIENSVYGSNYPVKSAKKYHTDTHTKKRYLIHTRELDGAQFFAVPR